MTTVIRSSTISEKNTSDKEWISLYKIETFMSFYFEFEIYLDESEHLTIDAPSSILQPENAELVPHGFISKAHLKKAQTKKTKKDTNEIFVNFPSTRKLKDFSKQDILEITPATPQGLHVKRH